MSRRFYIGIGAALLAILASGLLLTKDQWDWLLEDGSVQTQGVQAPGLKDVDHAVERLYRIGDGSSASYTVEEQLAGTTRTTSGTTPAIAGEIALNTGNLKATRIGTIVVNVEMLTSDSSLRDRRIRHDFLESTHYPFAEFDPRKIDGLPKTFTDGSTHQLDITGKLTVKETTRSVTFSGDVTVEPDELTAEMQTQISMSDFDAGPIDIAGLVHTDDDLRIDLSLIAPRVELDTDPDPVASFAEEDFEPRYGEFAAEVMPILEASCAGCHARGNPGFATVALETAGDAAAIADDIALVTQAGYMPPWPASDAGLTFKHDWSLSEQEIAAIAEWAASGGGLDVPTDTKLTASVRQFRPVERDVVATAEPYVGLNDNSDDYRCQIYEVGDLASHRWIRAFDIEPDQAETVHHAAISRVDADMWSSAMDETQKDPLPGWECIGSTGLERVTDIGIWAPGAPAVHFPEGVGVHLSPGEFVVVQIHYHYDHATPADRSALIVDLASEAELAAAGGELKPVEFALQAAPVEIPCTAAESGPLCDRDAVKAELEATYGAWVSAIGDILLTDCGQSLDDYIGDTDGVVTAHCDKPVTQSGRIHRLWAHMHELGSSFQMILNPDTPGERLLLDIPVWSFEWQLDYEPSENVVLNEGDVIRIECTWDRSLGHMPEPRYITNGVGTNDEMCGGSVATLPTS